MDTFPITPFNFPFYLFYFSDLIRHKFDPALLFVSYLFLTLLGNSFSRCIRTVTDYARVSVS